MRSAAEHAWPVKRLRFLMQQGLSDKRRKVLADARQVTFLPMENIGEQGEIDCSITRDIEDVRNGYTQFFDGDVLVAKITPCFENGKGALVQGTLSGVGFGTTELHVLAPTDEIDARFLYYVTVSNGFRGRGEASMFGSAGQKRVPEDFVRDYRVPIPPPAQQRAIADHLDREAARLDTLVAAKERMLELLAERRQALITTAVTRGVDSAGWPKPPVPDALLEEGSRYKIGTGQGGDRASVARGDEVAVQTASPFPTKRLKHVVSLQQSRVHRNGSGSPYVGLEQIESWTGKLFNGLPATTVEDASQSNFFNPGDVLFGKLRPYLAKVWVAEFAGRSTTECLVMKPIQVEPRFLGYACLRRDFIDVVDASTFGSKMPRADWGFIGNMPVPVPDRHRQRAIADYLDRETARLDELAAKTRRTIALLKERRAALIAAAITGRIDVKSAA